MYCRFGSRELRLDVAFVKIKYSSQHLDQETRGITDFEVRSCEEGDVL